MKKTTKRKKSKPTRLKVTCIDGKIIQEQYAWQTLAMVVEKIGAEKVLQLHKKRANIDIVSDELYQESSVSIYQKKLKSGFYLYTKSSTNDKLAQIEEMKKELNIQWIAHIDIIRS